MLRQTHFGRNLPRQGCRFSTKQTRTLCGYLFLQATQKKVPQQKQEPPHLRKANLLVPPFQLPKQARRMAPGVSLPPFVRILAIPSKRNPSLRGGRSFVHKRRQKDPLRGTEPEATTCSRWPGKSARRHLFGTGSGGTGASC